MRIVLFLVTLSFVPVLFAKTPLNNIDANKIGNRKIEAYIHHQQELNVRYVEDIEESFTPNATPEGYSTQKEVYHFSESLSEVWHNYTQTNPTQSWEHKMLRFGFMASQKNGRIYYKNDTVNEVEPGQIMVMRLRLLGGIKNVAVGFKFTLIDKSKQMVEFSYLKGNASEGKQQIVFMADENGGTEIVHTSYYKSNSKFRDRYLYPFFHKRITNSFHRNMQNMMENQTQLAEVR